MTGRYFRSQPDFHTGATEPRDIAIVLAKTRQNIEDIENVIEDLENTVVTEKNRAQKERILTQLRNDKEQKDRVLAQLRAIELHMSKQLRDIAMQISPEQALSWIENTLRGMKDEFDGIENLMGLGSLESVCNTTYAAYEWIVTEIIRTSGQVSPEQALANVGLLQFLESVLVEMDNLANKVAVYEECQRPMPSGTTNGKHKRNAPPLPENDWLKLLNGY